MKFVPKEADAGVNVPKQSHIVEFFKLVFGLAAIFAVVYIMLGFLVDLIVPTFPDSIENSIKHDYTKDFTVIKAAPAQKKVDAILARLLKTGEHRKLDYRAFIIETPDVNAFAAPGGNILITSGLLRHVKSENELAFILAHELGHFEHRDHLRGIGRSLVLSLMIAVITGADESAGKIIANSAGTFQLKYSRDQERRADRYGVDLLAAAYGNAAGAAEVMEGFSKLSKMPDYVYFFTTHPNFHDRLDRINARIKEKGYPIKKTISLGRIFDTIKTGRKDKQKYGF